VGKPFVQKKVSPRLFLKNFYILTIPRETERRSAVKLNVFEIFIFNSIQIHSGYINGGNLTRR
jgi:hypothetical protein